MPFGVALEELGSNIGPGYAMYFQYVKWCVLILICVMFSEGFLNLWDNYNARNIVDLDSRWANYSQGHGFCV